MTSREKLADLAKLLPQIYDLDVLALVAREIGKLARAVNLEHESDRRALRQAHDREHQLREFLREALRGWIAHSPELGDAIRIWQMARIARLGEEQQPCSIGSLPIRG